MPFLDGNRDLGRVDLGAFDHTIVGAGAAGILLAVRLAESGRKVLLLESGDIAPSDDRDALNRIEQSGKPLSNPITTRRRAVGGTTIAWGGQSLPFSPLDFEPRDWARNSGWPIDFREVERYYARANQFIGVDKLDYRQAIDRRLGIRPVAFDPDLVDRHYAKWSTEPNFLKRHGRRLKAGVTVLYNSHLTRIDLDETGAASVIEIANFSGQRREGRVSNLILAAGGIETTRLLLLNNHQVADGLGSGSGWLGRGFMDHPACDMGVVETGDMRRLQSVLGVRFHWGRLYSVRMSASPRWQRANRKLNVSASLLWRHEGDTFGPFAELRELLRQPTLKRLARVGTILDQLLPGLWVLATEGVVYKPGATAVLSLMAEQEAICDSRITLGQETDRFGQRLANLDWRITDLTWETMVSFTDALIQELSRLGLGTLKPYDYVRADNADWRGHVGDVNHHMGAARMSARPEDGVVDSQLQVWGIPNLHVCSTAVFPTASHSNPTLNLLALTERLAEKLVRA
ncbi:choline dehydrogenase-like flavoprotein [Caulobacter ginsengisoli]|uniref:Choline dehydrogenase-like flavoprotein n=1 Tax=Caulobacter ginsengisoli TaxID=400775 RepID=A0ABU0INV5_9CAUL|nr:GMC family oxidoreductase [Caulobacter ginsengisoli]MDQ0463110.1 choline dehydrogenase-like flavoprotein [Caulobacter ginsengisoli]